MKNKWLIALSAIGIHICIGSVYAWSVLTKPIMEQMGFSLQATTWTFSIAILFLGLSAGFLGSFVEKYGPRVSGLTSTVFFGAGMFGTAFALYSHSLILLYLFYGVIGGIALGTGYITPVSTLVKYFPKRRGFATGLAIMGFGFASLIAGPIMQLLVANFGLITNFIILGGVYMAIMAASSLYLAPPPKQLVSSNNIKKSFTCQSSQSMIKNTVKQYTVNEATKDWKFYALWWVFFTNITCGIGLLAVASPMAQEITKMTPVAAASMVGIIGLINGAGRIAWSTISDYLGRKNTYILFFLIEICSFYALAQTTDSFIFQLLVLIIVSCYGGGFSCMPAYLSDLFGTKQLSAIHGRILTAWGMAGIVGPLLLSLIRENTDSYALCLYVFSGLLILSLILSIILKNKTTKKEQLLSSNNPA